MGSTMRGEVCCAVLWSDVFAMFDDVWRDQYLEKCPDINLSFTVWSLENG